MKQQPSLQRAVRLAFVFVGLFGIAFAVAGALAALPKPAVGGTCGPPNSSEASIVAFFDPVSIEAGTEPPAADVTERYRWLAFVSECQASTDSRVLGTFAILVLSLAVAVVGTTLLWRPGRRSTVVGDGVTPRRPVEERVPT